MKNLQIIFLFTLIQFTLQAEAKEKVSVHAFGTIEKMNGDSAHYIASGFVCFRPNLVVTCLHVVKDLDSIYYHPGNYRENFLLTKKVTFAPLDLAILQLPEGVNIDPLKFDDDYIANIGDTIDYLGYDRPTTEKNDHVTLTEKQSIISLKDRHYLYFEGYCHTGYSGAPVLNMESKVIGMISGGKKLNEKENLMLVRCPLLKSKDISKYFIKP